MKQIQFGYRDTGLHFIPQYRIVSSTSDGQSSETPWEDMVYGTTFSETSILNKIGYNLAGIQDWEFRRWYYKDTKEVFFVNRVLCCAFLGAAQAILSPDNFSKFSISS